ncbi:unnamed protein product, partial [Phaeothamnion confervicola]
MTSASRRTGNSGVDSLERHGLLESGGAGSGGGGDDEWVREADFTLFDPVWGPPDYERGHRPRPCQASQCRLLYVMGILCCPCCMGKGGACGERNKAVWRRIRWRAATILCAVQTLLFVLSIIVNGGFQPWIYGKEPNILLGPSAATLVKMGAKLFLLIRDERQLWRLFTPILLHGGLIHLLMNMLSQFRLGIFLEERWGSRVWLTIYFVGGIGGNLLSCVTSPEKAGVGASGAIYAIMGGWLAHILCTWDEDDEFGKVGQLLQAVGYSVLGMVMSLAPIVDWAAHLGGFVVGFALAWWFFHKPAGDSHLMLREPCCKKLARRQG